MFDYPIPPLRFGLYAELGLGPEATSEEINEARQELSSQLKSRQKTIQRELDAVYQKVPGLREAWEKLKTLEEAEGDAEEFRETQLKLAALEEKAMQVHPEFKALRDTMGETQHRIHEINSMPIQNPEDRLEYDQSHPPLELIDLADCGASLLDDPKVMLRMVRLELSEFFEQSGEAVFHPSDLTRNDFSHDFTQDRNLDRKL